jgi:thiol:disulfide interchange protein
VLCIFPVFRRFLPRPGVWMETFRQFLSFPMFASAAWLVWVLAQQVEASGVLQVLMGMVALGFALWLLKQKTNRFGIKFLVMCLSFISLLFAGSAFLSPPRSMDVMEKQKLSAETFSYETLDGYLERGDAVFVNMTAAWCITCKVNEKIALYVPSTRMLFEEKNIRYLKGDWTSQNPEITKFLSGYGRNGVPLYVYYGPVDDGGSRPDPVVLPQLLTPGVLKEAIK